MATSSIFANVKITDPEQAEKFVEILDESANDPRNQIRPVSTARYVTDENEIKTIMEKALTRI